MVMMLRNFKRACPCGPTDRRPSDERARARSELLTTRSFRPDVMKKAACIQTFSGRIEGSNPTFGVIDQLLNYALESSLK